MAIVKTPSLKVLYNDKDITTDIHQYLTGFTYTDKVAGESDEIELEFEDTRQLWKGSWYPDKGARLTVDFGYIGRMVPAGVFQVDEIELSGPPDVVRVRGLATGVTSALRTRNNFAHEDKTLRQIAEVVASAHGYTVEGEIEDIRIGRATQSRETDLAFLARIAGDYGHVFSVRDTSLIFSNVYDLEAAEPVDTVDKTQVGSYSFKDTTSKTYKSSKVKHHKPLSKGVIDARAELGSLSDGVGGSDSSDTYEGRERAENELQAQKKAKAKLHKKNSHGITATLNMEGNPYFVAGNNFELTGFGVLSGIWHITQSRHTVSKGEGYRTELECKRVKKISEDKWVPKIVREPDPVSITPLQPIFTPTP